MNTASLPEAVRAVRRGVRWLVPALVPFLLGPPPAAAGCGEPAAGQRRVGLVLSGGGARALAHVGVLEVIEREGVQVDCVAGTSMGAAIGALWAAGYPTAAIAGIVRSVDWQEVFSGRRVRGQVPLALRIDDLPPALRAGLEGRRPRLPASRDSDYRLNRLLFKSLAAAGLAAGDDFDRLPRPFRAAATDLATAERVVLAEGSLARAVRASMSTPVTLPVVFVDGRQLVDGGITDNVPVDLARAMGADVVIVSDASEPPLQPEQYRDAYGIGIQLVDVLRRARGKAFEQTGDVVVQPALGRHSSNEYSGTEALIAAGRQAATAAMVANPRLRALAAGRSVRPTPAAAPVPVAPFAVTAVEVRGARRIAEATVRDAFGVKAGDAYDVERALRGFDRVWALGLFETVWIDAHRQGDGVALMVDVRETPHLFFELGGGSNEADHVSSFVRLRDRNAFGRAERVDVELDAGIREYGVRAGLTAGGLGTGRRPIGLFARGAFIKEEPLVYVRGDDAGRARFARAVADGGLHLAFGPDVLLQAGLAAGRVASERRPGLGLPVGTDAYRVLHGAVAWDRLDDRDRPDSGAEVVVRGERSLTALGADGDYWRARGTARGARRLGGPFVVEAAALVGLSGRDVPVYDLFRLGGPIFLPGRPRDELWARQVLGLSLAPSVDVRGLRIAVHGGIGNAWHDRSQVSLSDLRGGVGLAATLAHRLGLVSLDTGVDETGHAAFYVSIGHRPRD